MSLEDHIGEYVDALVELVQTWEYDSMSESEIRIAKESLIDTVACGMEGALAGPTRIVANAMSRRGGTGDATVLGTTQRLPVDAATHVNGVMIRSYDLNDTWIVPLERGDLPLQGSHPSENIPPALAVAERHHVDGRRFLASIGLAYELNARFVSMVTGRSLAERGFHHGTFAGLIVPLVTSYLMDLSREATANALGIGATRATLNVIDTMSKRPNNATKSFAYPSASAAAVLGTELAADGYTGPVSALEGYGGVLEIVYGDESDVDQLVATDSHEYAVRTLRKVYPADATTQGTVHSLVSLISGEEIDPETIDAVDVYTGTRCHVHTKDPDSYFTINEETADHSLRYLCSVACLDGEVVPEQYRTKRYRDADVASFADRLTFSIDESYDHTPQAGRVQVHLEGGTTLERETIYPPGNPENPLSREQIEDKFRRYWDHHNPDANADAAARAVENVEDLDDVGELLRVLAIDESV